MIAFLMIISLIVIAVFLYIITIQKLPNYAVLRVQGIANKVLIQKYDRAIFYLSHHSTDHWRFTDFSYCFGDPSKCSDDF